MVQNEDLQTGVIGQQEQEVTKQLNEYVIYDDSQVRLKYLIDCIIV